MLSPHNDELFPDGLLNRCSSCPCSPYAIDFLGAFFESVSSGKASSQYRHYGAGGEIYCYYGAAVALECPAVLNRTGRGRRELGTKPKLSCARRSHTWAVCHSISKQLDQKTITHKPSHEKPRKKGISVVLASLRNHSALK